MVNIDEVTTAGGDEPSWKQRAVERSPGAAKLRAEQRVQRFLDAAQSIITDKGTTDFTVQEVVDVSRQSLRSFYQHFDGKHELLLALFEDAPRRDPDRARRRRQDRPDRRAAHRRAAAVRALPAGPRRAPGAVHRVRAATAAHPPGRGPPGARAAARPAR